jgi:hypothetical protein
MRVAVACNLHSVLNDTPLAFPESIMPQPTTVREVRDRINAFWAAFVVDRAGSFLEGLPVSIPDEVRRL